MNGDVQRFRCVRCGKTFSERQPLDGVRIESRKAAQVVQMLCEGVGVRAISRLTGLCKDTVLNVLQSAGQHCEQLMADKVKNVQVGDVQIDEVFGFVGCLQQNTSKDDVLRGDQYAFIAIDRATKLILHVHVGKRDGANTGEFLRGLKFKFPEKFQLTSDGFDQYSNAYTNGVKAVFGNEVDYATEVKTYGPLHPGGFGRRNNPVVCKSVWRKARIGFPKMRLATVNHVERQNLSVRLFNRRFTRKTLGYSKKLDNHRWAMLVQVAHFNFCRVHSAHGKTPAMEAGLTDHVWTVKELLHFTA